MRRIIGWRREEDEDWYIVWHRMKIRLERVLLWKPIVIWSVGRYKSRLMLLHIIESRLVFAIVGRAMI